MVDGKWNKFRDDVDHHGRLIDWGHWAITGNDHEFGGTGNPDTGDLSLTQVIIVQLCAG
jgi:alpha-amylase